jgi:hypothetical protein
MNPSNLKIYMTRKHNVKLKDMENEKYYRVVVDMTQKDGRSYFNISLPEEQVELNLSQVRLILMGALALTIRSSENESEAMRNVISYLESEFVSVDSFSDHEIKVKKD